MTDRDLQDRADQIRQLERQNMDKYTAAKADRDVQRATFRRQHPRSKVPSSIERIDPPPDLMSKWNRLLKRRREAIRKIEAQREEFVDRMSEGRIRAMQRRERNVRRLMVKYAREIGLEFTEGATDKRLEELLATMSDRIETSVATEVV